MYEPEQVDEYSVALGKLFRWLQAAIDLREEDVMQRREHIQKLKEERQAALDASVERDRLRNQDLDLARQVRVFDLTLSRSSNLRKTRG